MQTKLQLAIEDLEKYSTEKLCLELKEADLCEEVEKCISKCATKDVATFDDHVDGFNRALAQVAALYPNVDLFGTRIYKDVVDGKGCVIYEAVRCGNVVKFLHRKAIQDVKFKDSIDNGVGKEESTGRMMMALMRAMRRGRCNVGCLLFRWRCYGGFGGGSDLVKDGGVGVGTR
ncbi:hypothetical protein JHK87_050020 [Glycine soja]|nr:hypothetical protein JHK87_050020 [Glycine soja]